MKDIEDMKSGRHISEHEIIFVDSGRPAMGIAATKAASDTEQYAAEELRAALVRHVCLVQAGRWQREHTFEGQGLEQALLGKVQRWGMLALDLRTANVTMKLDREVRLRQTVAIRQAL